MVALPILAFLLLFLLLRAASPSGEWQRDFPRATVLWMSYLVLMTEALGRDDSSGSLRKHWNHAGWEQRGICPLDTPRCSSRAATS